MSKIKVMLADDHTIFREMLAEMINEKHDNMHVTGQAENGQVLLDLIENNIPDIVILDLEMPVLDGQKTLEIISKRFPTVKTIILSVHYDTYYLAHLMVLGACGYLSKTCSREDLIHSIEKVNHEGYSFDEKISKEVLFSMFDKNKLANLITENVLSERETQVLKLLCDENLYKEIADKLSITKDTIKFHVKNIYKKTQTKSIAGVVKYAIKVRIINLY